MTEVIEETKIEKEIKYFADYKKSLHDFMNVESLNLSIKEYMQIVIETQVVSSHLEKLKTKN